MKCECKCYQINNNGEYATIFIREGHNEKFGTNWGEISILSSYGKFGHYWGNIGEDTFCKFLSNIHFDYAMGKMCGDIQVFDFYKSVDALKEAVAKEQLGDEDKEHFEERINDIEENTIEDIHEFSKDLDENFHSLFTYDEMSDIIQYSYNPQLVGFWDKIWNKFIEELKNDERIKVTDVNGKVIGDATIRKESQDGYYYALAKIYDKDMIKKITNPDANFYIKCVDESDMEGDK